MLLEPNEEGLGVQDCILRSDGIGRQYLHIKAGGSMYPPSKETVELGHHFVHQEGQQVFKFAVTNILNGLEAALTPPSSRAVTSIRSPAAWRVE